MGATKGAGLRINRQFPKAVLIWCATHKLNRIIVQSCTEPTQRNMIGTVDSVSTVLSRYLDLFVIHSKHSQKFFVGCEILWVFCSKD